MKRIIIFGNSGSGKSTLANHLSYEHSLAHLDLDTLAWQNTQPPVRQPINHSLATINEFTNTQENWVIEGCYSDLLQPLLAQCNELYFMDLPITQCISNAKNRPWEPHKYADKAAQDKNLDRLISWIGQYEKRNDTFSASAHQQLFNEFRGTKHLLKDNPVLERHN